MLRVYSCIVHEHNLPLLLVAAGVCFISAMTAFAVYEQVCAKESRRLLWGALAAFVSGIGIWSTHFVAMLAYEPSLSVGYDLNLTVLSIITAVLVTGAGWAASMMRGYRGPLFGGTLLGVGIGAMHYLGMSGVQMAGRIVWDQGLVATSMVLGIGLSIVALAEHRRTSQQSRYHSAVLFTLAICSLHFVAMSAAAIYPDSSLDVPVEAISSATLAVAVTAVALVILSVSFAVVLFDRSLARRAIEEAQRILKLADALKREAEISSAALDNIAQGLSMYDADDRLIIWNRRYAELYSIPENMFKVGMPLRDVLAYLVESGAFPGKLDYYIGDTENSRTQPGRTEVQLGSGRLIEIQRRPLPTGGWIATHEDITERRNSAQRITYLAGHDPLTDLPNRTSFAEHVQTAIGRVARGHRFALHTIDLDRFKEVNDTLGHPIGDEILRQVATRLKRLVREDDHVARLGGDEFALIQADVQDPTDAGALATRIIATLSDPFEFAGHTIAIGATVGIAFSPEDGADKDELLKKSDVALYRAKAESRGTYRVFETGMDARLRERRELEADLRTALLEGQFELHYQPVLDVATRTISTFEALIRWRHPTRGLVQPDQFIATAEETGLIIPIGEWVLRQACCDAAAWDESIKVAVNLSAAQFKRGDLVSVTTSALAAAKIAPERLELEITESALLHDEAWVLSVLHGLRNLGIRIAMDDFGTGYSSLSYLRSFPFTKIKIDRTFVSDLAQTTDGLAIIQATIQLSEKLGMSTTAEGVETLEQMNILIAEGCTELQGYHISRAVPAEKIASLISEYNNGDIPRRAAAAA